MRQKNPEAKKLQSLKTEIGWTVRKSIDLLVKVTPPHLLPRVSQKKQLLIVRIDAIGDFVIFTGILPYFRELYPAPEWEITLLGGQDTEIFAEFVTSDVISFEPVFDSFIPIDRFAFLRNLIYRFKFQKKMQKLFYDTIIYPVYSRSRDGDQLVNIINAKEKIAIDGDCRNIPSQLKKVNNKIYTKLIPSEEAWISEIERNVSFIKKLGIQNPIDGVPRWKIPADLVATSKKFLAEKKIQGDFSVVCPGASKTFRIWPPHKVAEVIDYLWVEYKLPTLICGSPEDKLISLKIQKFLKSAQIVCVCGETNLIELSALMSFAKMCITMDSGSAHIAVAVNAHLICIIGGGHYKRFFPYGNPNRFRAVTEELDCFYCNWNCKFEQPICVRDISVATAIKEIDNLMIMVNEENTPPAA